MEHFHKSFFESNMPMRKYVQIKLVYQNVAVHINTKDFCDISGPSLTQSIEVSERASDFLRRQKLEQAFSCFPTLLEALKTKKLALSVKGHVLPLDVLIASPELLTGGRHCEIIVDSPVIEKFNEARSNFEQEDFENAKTFLLDAMNAGQERNPVLLLLLGRIEKKLGNSYQAMALFETCEKVERKYAKCYYHMAMLMAEQERHEKVVVTLYDAKEYDIFQTFYGERLFQLGRDSLKTIQNGRIGSTLNAIHAFNLYDTNIFFKILDRLEVRFLIF